MPFAVQYEMWQWVLFAVAAMIVGLSKCGIPGIGILIVVLLQHALLAKEATGFGLSILIMGDFCAALIYRMHAEWPLVFKLAPFVVAGGAIGWAFAQRARQAWFDRTAFWLSALAVAHLLWKALSRYAA